MLYTDRLDHVWSGMSSVASVQLSTHGWSAADGLPWVSTCNSAPHHLMFSGCLQSKDLTKEGTDMVPTCTGAMVLSSMVR